MPPCLPAGPVFATVISPAQAAAMQAALAQKIQVDTINTTQRGIEKGLNEKDKASKAVQWFKDFSQKHAQHIATLMKWVTTFVKTMKMIARFYPIIVLVLIILAFFGKPLEYIMLFLGGVIVSILWIFIWILDQDVVAVIPYSIYQSGVYLIPYLLYAFTMFILFFIISIFCLILAGINGLLGGRLKHWVLCQNSPEAWFKTPSFQDNNLYKRSFFCAKPCGSRFKPDGDDACKRLDKTQPSYCPQAEIMRLYTGYSTGDSPSYYSDYNTSNPNFLAKSPYDREMLLKEYYMKQINFNQTCQEAMTPYTDITLNICSNLDMLENTGKIDKATLVKLKNVCAQTYCNASSNYPFCSSKAKSSDMDMSQLVKQIIKIIAIITVFFILLIFILNKLYPAESAEFYSKLSSTISEVKEKVVDVATGVSGAAVGNLQESVAVAVASSLK
jgi:hypothetical protein